MKKIFSFTLIAFFIIIAISGPLALAQDRDVNTGGGNRDVNVGGRPDLSLPSPLKEKTIEGLLKSIIGYVTTVAVPLSSVMIIFGAFQIMFAGGDPEKASTGRKTITYAVVGLAIVLLSYVLIAIIEQVIGRRPVNEPPPTPPTFEPGYFDISPGA